MKLLFHCCCGPCMAVCTEGLADCGFQPELFWYNPNIHPFTEYENRRVSLAVFAVAQKWELILAGKYGLRPFLQSLYTGTEGVCAEAPKRCAFCYRMRLEKTAAFAAENGFDVFSTSLLASPYQNHEEIRSVGEVAAAHYGVTFFYRDFRPYFRAGQKHARTMGLYAQKYCGCIFSEEERYAKKEGAVLL